MNKEKQIVKIKAVSGFKDRRKADHFFKEWVNWLSELNETAYEKIPVDSLLGTTVVWAINSGRTDLKTIVIFPGFRTCSLLWDLDNALKPLKKDFRVFLIDTNGQPCLSDGNTPAIRSKDYGIWAADLFEKLAIKNAIIAGASFGALVCLKLCIVAPQLVEKAVLLNPGCLQPFSLSIKNLYYNFLPLISPTRKNIEKFLDKAILYKDRHTLSPAARRLIIDYEWFAITEFRDHTQKPYAMSKSELAAVRTDIHLVMGDKDILFPYKKSVRAAKQNIQTLRSIHIVSGAGHGIETSKKAINILAAIAGEEPIHQSEPVNVLRVGSD